MKLRKLMVPLAVSLVLVASTLGIAYAATSTMNGTTYTHPSWYSSSTYKLFHGVDVSYYQGQNINWTKVKKSGTDFAFIRLGYSGSSSGYPNLDSTFVTNVKNAYAAGVNVGIYYWSEATTPAEAKAEADYVIQQLAPYKTMITMPVIMDYEFHADFRSTIAYNALKDSKGKTVARSWTTANATAFMDEIRTAGYTPMLYSYRALVDWSSRKFDMTPMNNGTYKFWLAQYDTSTSYAGSMEYWQYTSTGGVSGISGNVDRNFWYYNNSAVGTTSGTTSIKDCSVTLDTSSYVYSGDINKPSVTVKNGGTTLIEGTDYVLLYLRNVKAGTASVIVRGIGSYSNEQIANFSIGTVTMSSSNSTVSDISDQSYTGSSICPSPTVTCNGVTLSKGTDYALTYSDNKSAGTATITITGKGNYNGTLTKTFSITKIKPAITTSSSKYAYARYKSFSLGAKSIGGKLTYSSSNKSIARVSSTGTVTTGSTSGIATITVKSAATANTYTAYKKVTVGVVAMPKTPYLSKVKKVKKGYFRAYWKNVTSASGYLVKYSRYKSFSSARYYRVYGRNTRAATVYDKYSGKYCYVKVITFKKVNGLYVYGYYSNVRKVKVR